MDTKTYKRCEFIIRQFMSVEKPTAELSAMFHEWLLDGHNCLEKNVVIRKVFYEALSDTNIDDISSNEISSRQKFFFNELFSEQKIQ